VAPDLRAAGGDASSTGSGHDGLKAVAIRQWQKHGRRSLRYFGGQVPKSCDVTPKSAARNDRLPTRRFIQDGTGPLRCERRRWVSNPGHDDGRSGRSLLHGRCGLRHFSAEKASRGLRLATRPIGGMPGRPIIPSLQPAGVAIDATVKAGRTQPRHMFAASRPMPRSAVCALRASASTDGGQIGRRAELPVYVIRTTMGACRTRYQRRRCRPILDWVMPMLRARRCHGASVQRAFRRLVQSRGEKFIRQRRARQGTEGDGRHGSHFSYRLAARRWPPAIRYDPVGAISTATTPCAPPGRDP